MDGYIEPAPWAARGKDLHALFAIALLALSGYLAFVLVQAMLAPPPAAPAQGDGRVSIRIETRARPVVETTDRRPEPERSAPPLPADSPAPAPQTREASDPAPSPVATPKPGRDATPPRLDLSLPTRVPSTQPVCGAGPCQPGVADGRRRPPAERRPIGDAAAGVDSATLTPSVRDTLGIERDAADGFGAQSAPLGAGCELVQRGDNVATRQMTARQFIRCSRSSASEARAQALVDALREKRPDLFEDR